MVAVAHTVQDIEVTVGKLQGELHRLTTRKELLERELAAVAAHLDSVLVALGALQHFMKTVPAPPAGQDETRPRRAENQRPHEHAVVPTARRGNPGSGRYGSLTEEVMKIVSAAQGATVRARDVAAALGRDSDTGSINGVRSTLDRLVANSRIQRAGRGLYRANPS
ncbi:MULTISPECIES: hypothetical protein [Streptomyces]|uniref:Uncharacterized protein n=2 Tax=Streptomyces TaxID=1883 RepID=A0A101PSE1_STRCK|nr:hypothetical protein [Streptomyces corchorusii]KUN16563.1 hypothetical protein AQJ11_39125 [Streptomyces corchorusii]